MDSSQVPVPPPATSRTKQQQQHHQSSSSSASASASQAASSLALLLREDPLLTKYNLHLKNSTGTGADGEGEKKKNVKTHDSSSNLLMIDEEETAGTNDGKGKNGSGAASFAYAAALLLEEDYGKSSSTRSKSKSSSSSSSSASASIRDHQERAEDALGEVERKLALVESLAERVSRTSPEAVAGPLLRLHGYTTITGDDDGEKKAGEEYSFGVDDVLDGSNSATTSTTTLIATRERCDRLKRQGDVLEGVANRVESSLQRGLTRMETATNRLSRVLQLSATLKMILRLQFESSKLDNYILDDLRDLTRAAASVAVIEDLLSRPELKESHKIDVVESIRPKAIRTAAAVRQAAAELLAQQQDSTNENSIHNSGPPSSASSVSSIVQLGATLQVYYHLGELPQAAWSAVNHALAAAERVTNEFWSPTTLANLTETATTEARLSAGHGNKKLSDASVQRALKNKLKEFRAQAAGRWSNGIADAAVSVWNLQQVLSRKTDPVTRRNFLDVVSESPIPDKYRSDTYEMQLLASKSSGPGGSRSKAPEFSIFSLFWERLCVRMGDRLKHILEYENGKFSPDVSALYPAVRTSSLHMIAQLKDTMRAAGVPGSSSMMMNSLVDDPASSSAASSSRGLLGGSSALDDPFLQWTTQVVPDTDSNPTRHGGSAAFSADSWTAVKGVSDEDDGPDGGGAGGGTRGDYSMDGDHASNTSMSTVFSSSEWLALQGNHASQKGLFRLQMAFLDACNERLCAPLRYLFAENVTIDDMGNPISHMPLLPSKYDIQKFDTNIRQELAVADPREGGGDLSSVTMLADQIVSMIRRFCEQAETAIATVSDEGCIHADGSPTEAMIHNLKVTKIMFFMNDCLRTAPEKVFLEPYRPAVTNQLEEAASVAMRSLLPAREEIDDFVSTFVLNPLCRALNRRIAALIGRMHQEGAYLQHGSGVGLESSDVGASSFVQKHLTGLYDNLATTYLAKLPPPYSIVVGSRVSIFSVYNFVSNASLIRPLGEDAKLHLTQDLADFELVVDQFMSRAGGNSESKSLSEIGNGKVYAELRAVRNMLFWTGLEDRSKPAGAVAKSILREVWVRDIRPSTVFHYLFSYAPNLLSSPHHWKKMKADEYVRSLVSVEGDIEEGESSDWMTTMSCCDSYQQRESAQSSLIGRGPSADEGDPRVSAILMALGPELLLRRRP
mmetsp:Transcript_29950/g.72609  ORF Transcript_29950/g.72609 Transcript_29950/m.72609 type:complete len:1186 (+) Transcript_29950:321-3878(+)